MLGRLLAWIETYLKPYDDVAVAFIAPADVIWSAREYVQPDLFVTPAEQVTGDWRDVRTRLLAVEVLSPSSAQADRVKKRRLYQDRGVVTYWVVDADARLVEVWHPGDERPEIVTDVLRWRVTPEAPELAIALAELFSGLPA